MTMKSQVDRMGVKLPPVAAPSRRRGLRPGRYQAAARLTKPISSPGRAGAYGLDAGSGSRTSEGWLKKASDSHFPVMPAKQRVRERGYRGWLGMQGSAR